MTSKLMVVGDRKKLYCKKKKFKAKQNVIKDVEDLNETINL